MTEGGTVDLCSFDPGHELDLLVTSSLRSMTAIWMGLTTIKQGAAKDPTLADVLAGFVDAVERARSRSGRAVTDFSLIARNAAMQALESVTVERSPSLWQAATEDRRTTIATFASTERFGELAQGFFTNLLQGHLRYFLDREIPLHVGRSSYFRSIADTSYFERVVRQHCVETTVIMRAFAKEWLGKNRFHLEKDLTRQDAAGFAAYAFTKVRNELAMRTNWRAAASRPMRAWPRASTARPLAMDERE